MHMIVHKFQKNSSIRFKNSFNQSWTFRGHFLVFPVGSVWFDYVFSNFYDESFNLNRVRPLRSTQFNEVNFSTVIDPFDHQKPMLYLFKTQNHVSFIDWHTFNYRNSDFEAILRFRFFPCFPQCDVQAPGGCIHLLNTRKYCDNTGKDCGNTYKY